MTRTIELQVEKTRSLIQGMRAHLDELSAKGIQVRPEQFDALERDLTALITSSEECDRLRKEVSEKVHATNAQLASIKEQFADLKKQVKGNFLPEEWARYGVLDKR